MGTARVRRAEPITIGGPFDLADREAWLRWRERKLADYPRSAADLVVEVADPRRLTAAERAALAERCRRANMAIYASPLRAADKTIPRELGRQFGLLHLDGNWLADEDGISSLAVSEAGTRREFIPYTNRPIGWHTDGYYNPPARRVRAMVLHCVRDAARGGENRLLDHEMAYLLLREQDPAHVHALMAADAMTIPARTDADGVQRAAERGPVFHVDRTGRLHMRYTARTRSIEWKDDAATRAAVAALEAILAGDAPFIFRTRLAPGSGLLCNKRAARPRGFRRDPAAPPALPGALPRNDRPMTAPAAGSRRAP